MTTPTAPTNWRDLLRLLTERPADRQRVADELGVTPYTVTRWINEESEPRLRYFKRLPDIFPQHRALFSDLIQAELFLVTSPRPPSSGDHLKPEIPSEFLIRALMAYTTIRGPFRAWSLQSLTLRQAIEHLDADHLGTELTVIHCTPPLPGQPVRSLVARMSLGTAPWEPTIKRKIAFLGARSFSSKTVSQGVPEIVQDAGQLQNYQPFEPHSDMRSMAAWPLQREGKVAGCLTIVSTQPDYFTSTRLSFVEVYANTLALSFCDNDFYPLHSIALHDMPVLSEQKRQEHMVQFGDFVRQLRRERTELLSEAEREKVALQHFEAQVLLNNQK